MSGLGFLGRKFGRKNCLTGFDPPSDAIYFQRGSNRIIHKDLSQVRQAVVSQINTGDSEYEVGVLVKGKDSPVRIEGLSVPTKGNGQIIANAVNDMLQRL